MTFPSQYTTLYKALTHYAFTFVKDRAEAEDIVSVCFVKLWERWENFSTDYETKAWLYKSVRNTCLTKITRDKVVSKGMKGFKPDEFGEPHLNDIIRAETIAELHSLIAQIPPKPRKIITWLYIDGLTVRQICERFGLNVSTVKNQKRQGLKRMKQLMGV